MNKVYKCVWNAALGVWSVASELASAKKKTKSCVSLSDQGENPKSAIQNILLISAAASIGAMSSSAYAAPIHAEDTASAGNLNVQNVDFWKLLTDGYYNNQTKGNVYTTGGAVHLGNGATANNGGLAIGTNAAANLGDGLAGATSIGTSAYSRAGGTAIGSIAAAGNSAVALGRNALASKDSVAIGRGSAASAESSMALGRSTSATASNSVAIGNTSSVSQENTVSFGNADLQRKLTNVAKGQISSTSVDAINGSQLHSANSKVADALGGGSTVDANGNITAPVYSVDGKNVSNVGDAITNVDGRVTNNSNNIATNTTNITTNTNNIAGNTKDITDLNKTLTEGAFSVSANGEGATKVAKDAVIDFANTDNNITIAQDGTNLTFGLADQLNVKTGVTVGNSTLSSDGLAITGGPTISKGGIDAGNTIVSNIKDGVAATDAVSKGQLDKGLRDSGLIDADGNSIDAVTYTADGNVVLKDNDGKGTLISNVAAGKVTADSTDAINGSQLHSANSKVADALGGGSTVDANGNITAPVYSVDGKNVSNVGDAITNVDGRVTNNTTNITANTNNIADLGKTLTEGAFSVSANGEGATKVAKDAVIDFANTDNNITIAQDGTNLTFGLADQLNVKTGVTVGNSTLSSDGLAIAGGPTISKGGIDAGNTIVSNIKDGVAATDAVSKGQLDKGLRDSGLIDADGNSIDAVTYTADGNVVLKDNDGKGTLISNVAAGKVTADSTDAINGSQLHSANSKVADALGGGSTVDANGNITAPVYSVDGKNVSNVGDAITNVDGRVTNNTTNITANTNNIADLGKTLTEGAFSVSANGEGATKVAKDAVIDFANTDNNITIAQDGTNLTFGLADQLNVKSGVTVGNSTLSSDGLAITGGPTISKGGIDAGNTIVSNIKDGVAATDAVSKGQLDKGLRDSGLIDADGNSIDAVTYTADGNVVLKDNDGKGTLISNVAAGKVTADSTDAINGSQLHSANSKVADALGGGSTVDANGNITAPVYSVDGKNVSNVGDAITNVDGRVTNNTTNITTNTNNIAGNTKNITDLSKTLTEGAFSVSANGEGATKVAKDAVIDFANTDNNITIAQDGTNLTFGLADQLNVKTGVTVGNSTLSSDGLAITGGPTISKGGIDAGNTIVSNIKDGVAATDAVSKGQLDKGLRDSGLIDADGNSIDAVTYTADGNVVLKDNDGKGTLISNVAAGKVTADSTDAINGSQLHSANSKVADALGGGSTVDANGNITAPVYSVDGKNVNNVGDAISNVDSRVTNNTTNISTNTNNIAGNTKNITELNKTLTDGAFSVSANGEGATKVAKDAVIDFANTDNNITIAQDGTNLTFGLADQLNVKTGVTVGNSTLSSDGLAITGGPTISKGGIDAGNTIVSNIKDGVAATDAVSKGQLDKGLRDSGLIDADGNSIDAVTYTADGNVVLKDNDGKGTLISNVAAGKVTADSTDAINGSQLHSANSKVADALGGGSTVDANGNITAPVYSVDGKNVSNVGDAITNVDGRVTNNTTNITANTNNIADLGKTLTEGAFSVSANGTGAERVTRDAVIDYSNRDGNILISQNGSNFVFGLADHLNIKNAVTVGNSSLSSNGLVISGGPSITSNGIDAGNTIVSNIKDGVNANDAVSKGQLDRSLQASGLVDANGKAVDAVTYAPNGDVELKANNGQGTTLTNVAAGKVAAGSKDAINGGQLYDTTNSIANVIGGNTVVNSDGTISTSNIGGTGKDTIDDAIYSIQTQVAGAKSTVTAGKNVTVTATSNADGSQNFEVATADDLDVNSVTAKDVNASNVTAENITAKNVNVGNVKIDGTSNKVSGVANGTVSETSTDVVTGSQLHTTNSNVANYLGGGSSLNSDGSVSAPNYNVAGGSYHNVGDALTAVDSRVNNLEQAFYETNRSINDLKQNANAGIAGAMAVGNLPQPTEAGMSMVSAGASGYSGQSAIAIGVSGITDSNKIIWKMGGTADSKSNVGGAISVGYQWK